MGYALFAQRKLVLDAELNAAQLNQTMLSNKQYELATKKLNLEQHLASLNVSNAQQLRDLYSQLANDTSIKNEIDARINELQQQLEVDSAPVNAEIYATAGEEQAIEMQVKRCDTMVTALQKQLEAVEQAEGQAIDRATPKFGGVG